MYDRRGVWRVQLGTVFSSHAKNAATPRIGKEKKKKGVPVSLN